MEYSRCCRTRSICFFSPGYQRTWNGVQFIRYIKQYYAFQTCHFCCDRVGATNQEHTHFDHVLIGGGQDVWTHSSTFQGSSSFKFLWRFVFGTPELLKGKTTLTASVNLGELSSGRGSAAHRDKICRIRCIYVSLSYKLRHISYTSGSDLERRPSRIW